MNKILSDTETYKKMTTNNSEESKGVLSEKERTVTFSLREAEFIADTINSFDKNDAVRALEEVANQLFNNIENVHSDIGNYYYLLRQLREFHEKLIDRLEPVGLAYSKALK